MRSGIYVIRCGDSCYIGQAKNIGLRWQQHINDLLFGRHANRKLRDAVLELGLESLSFAVLEVCVPARLNEREWEWMVRLRPDLNLVVPDYAHANGARLARNFQLQTREYWAKPVEWRREEPSPQRESQPAPSAEPPLPAEPLKTCEKCGQSPAIRGLRYCGPCKRRVRLQMHHDGYLPLSRGQAAKNALAREEVDSVTFRPTYERRQ